MQTRSAEGRVDQTILRPAAVTRVLGAVAFLLVLAGIAGQLSRHVFGHGEVHELVRLFDFDVEGNVPTLFSVLLLLFAALLLAVIAASRKRQAEPDAMKWGVLAIGFLFMAIDEAASIDVLLILAARALLGQAAPDIFHWAWIIPGIAIVLLFALYFIGFILRLPPRMGYTSLLAGFLYVGGAVGCELIAEHYAKLHGTRSLVYNVFAAVGESLEMAGSIIFIYALLRYLADNRQEVRIRFR